MIDEVMFLGSVVRVRMRLKQSAMLIDTFNDAAAPPPARGEIAKVNFAHEDLIVIGE